MSVMARVRSLSESLHQKVLDEPGIATRLAMDREACDFERTSYLATWEDSGGRNAARRAQALDRGRILADRLEKEHAEVWTALGVGRADVDVALEIGRAGLGLGWALAGAAAGLFTDGGVAVGDDVGYGPPRIFSWTETASIADAVLKQPVADFAARYERGASAWSEWTGERADATSDPFESFAAVVAARVALARYLKAARTAGRALLVWAD